MERNVNVIKDIYGNNIVVINDIRFKGKRSVILASILICQMICFYFNNSVNLLANHFAHGYKWDDVKKYLEKFIGEFYEIADTKDIVYIGSDLPDEYTGSKYTYSLKGTAAKAKANAAQGIPEMLEIAVSRQFKQNQEKKHQWNAKNGWYKYESRFALPVFAENGEVERYNVFHASMLIRHANDGRLYLYDVLEIKKETGNPLES